MSLKEISPDVVRGVHLLEVDQLGRLVEPSSYRSQVWTPDGAPDISVKSQYGGIAIDEDDTYVVAVVEADAADVSGTSSREFTSRNARIVSLAYTKPRGGFWHGIFHSVREDADETWFPVGFFSAIVSLIGLTVLIIGIATTTAAAIGWGAAIFVVGLGVIAFIVYSVGMKCEGRCVYKTGSYRYSRREYLKADQVARIRQNYAGIPFFDSSATMLRVVGVTQVQPKVVDPRPDNDPDFWSRRA